MCETTWCDHPSTQDKKRRNTERDMQKLLRTVWIGQAAVPDYWTSLGQDFKKVEIPCKLSRSRTRWCRPDRRQPPTGGYLYFEMSFNHVSGPALMSATVRINLQSSPRVSMGSTAPEGPLGPRDPPTRQRSVTDTAEFNPRGGGGGFSGSLGSLSRQTRTQSSTRDSWFFRSSNCGGSEAKFDWGRSTSEDTTGLWRGFAGAIVFWEERQGQEQDGLERVTVSVSVTCKIKRCFFARIKGKHLQQIQVDTTWGELIDNHRFGNLMTALQGDIVSRNGELEVIGELTTAGRSYVAADQYFQCEGSLRFSLWFRSSSVNLH